MTHSTQKRIWSALLVGALLSAACGQAGGDERGGKRSAQSRSRKGTQGTESGGADPGNSGVSSAPVGSFEHAVGLAVGKKSEEALAAFRAFVAANPDHPRVPLAQVWIGDLELGQNRPAPAAVAYAASLTRPLPADTRPQALLGLARAHLLLKQDAAAVEPLRELFRAPARDAERGQQVARLYAETLLRLGRHADALTPLSRLAEDRSLPEAPARQLQLADTAVQARHLATAARAYQTFADRQPERPEAVPAGLWAAEAYLTLDRHDEAEQAFRAVIRRAGDRRQSLEAQLGLGRAALGRGSIPAARAAFEAATLLYRDAGDLARAEVWLAECDRLERRYAEAETRLLRLLAPPGKAGGTPASAAAHTARYFLARCLEETGRPEDARRYLEQLVAASDGGVWRQRARIRQVIQRGTGGDLPGAITALRALIAEQDAGSGTVDPGPGSPAPAPLTSHSPLLTPHDSSLHQELLVALGGCLLARGEGTTAARELEAIWPDVPIQEAPAAVRLVVARSRGAGADAAGGLALVESLLSQPCPPELRVAVLAARGELQLALKQSDAGVTSLRQALELRPGSDGARQAGLVLARHYRSTGRADLALQLETQLRRSGGERLPEGIALLARADQERTSGRHAEARRLYQQALAQSLDQPERLLARSALAELAARVGTPDEVTAELTRLEAETPPPATLAQVRARVALAFEQRGDTARAAAAFQAADAGTPDPEVSAEIHLGLGRLHALAGRADLAEPQFRKALDGPGRGTHHPRALYELGWLCLEQNREAEGEAFFVRLLQDHPSHPLAADAAFRLGEREYARARFAEAAGRYALAAGSTEKVAEAAGYKLGWSLRQTGDAAGAARAFRAVSERFPRGKLSLECRLRLGEALLKVGDAPGARTAFQSAITAPMGERGDEMFRAQARCALARLLLQQQDWEGARETAAEAARPELGRLGVEAQLLVARAVREKAGAAAAIEELRQATRLAGAYPELAAEARYFAAECQWELGKRKEAETLWRQIAAQFPGSGWGRKSRDRVEKEAGNK